MTKTLELNFLGNPSTADSFKYTISINGSPLVYSSGQATVDKSFVVSAPAVNQISRGSTLNDTITNTLANLQQYNAHPAVSYQASETSVFITVEYTGVLSVDDVNTSENIEVVGGGDIIFLTDPAPSKLRMTYNNDVVRFKGASNMVPLYCEVKLGNELTLRLQPDPLGQFFINFSYYIPSLLNTRNFADTIDPVLEADNPSSFVHNFSNGTFLQLSVSFSIKYNETIADSSVQVLSWLNGAEQINDYNNFSAEGLYVLSPFRKLSAHSYYLKYWQGYPFDISVYTTGINLTLTNTTNLLEYTFTTMGYGDRLFISDGRTDETLEDLLPLVDGYNNITISTVPTVNDKYLLLDKVPYKSGVYLKWLNKYGGYSYWLFEDTYSLDRSTKQLGELDHDMHNLEQADTRTIQIGKESQDTIRIVAELLTEDERIIVEGLLDSPKVYLFSGQPYARSSRKDWTEVVLKTTGARLKNPKQVLTNLTFEIELPARFTQRL